MPKTAPGVLSKCPDWLWACSPPPDLCVWQYLALVLVGGLRRRRPPDGRVVLKCVSALLTPPYHRAPRNSLESLVSCLFISRLPGSVQAWRSSALAILAVPAGDGAPRNGRESLVSSPVAARVSLLPR